MALRIDILPDGQAAVRGDKFEDTYSVRHVLRAAGLDWRGQLRAWVGEPQLAAALVAQLSKVPEGSVCAWDGVMVRVLAPGQVLQPTPPKPKVKPAKRTMSMGGHLLVGDRGAHEEWYRATSRRPIPKDAIGQPRWTKDASGTVFACTLVGYEEARFMDHIHLQVEGLDPAFEGYWGKAYSRLATWPEFHALQRSDPNPSADTPHGADPAHLQMFPPKGEEIALAPVKPAPVLTDMPDADDLFGKL